MRQVLRQIRFVWKSDVSYIFGDRQAEGETPSVDQAGVLQLFQEKLECSVLHEPAAGKIWKQGPLRPIKVFVADPPYVIHNLFHQRIFMQLAYDIMGLVRVSRGGPQSSVRSINLNVIGGLPAQYLSK